MLLNLIKQNWKGVVLWSNQFYGICATLLAIESTLFVTHEYPNIAVLLFIHLSTILFYTYSYEKENKEGIYNERSEWNQQKKSYLQIRQRVYFFVCVYLAFFKFKIIIRFLNAPIIIQSAILSSTILSFLYYIPLNLFSVKKSFRNLGIFKSVGIAIVWAVMCCLIPVWFSNFEMNNGIFLSNIFWIHFLQLFIYILILAILFDIKDINRDKEELVKTIVVKYGIRKTMHKIIYPLLILYACMIYWESQSSRLPIFYWATQICIIFLTYFFSKRVLTQKTIHVNILMIDGLMIIKAILSIMAIQTFVD